MIRKSPYSFGDKDQGVVKKTPSATKLFGGGRQKESSSLKSTYSGEECKNWKSSTKVFWQDKTP